MLSNKADTIEEYILKKLSEGEDKKSIELKRTELAGKVNCAPSQISYVLSTRFTQDKGFQVESQRGLGGYIRITIIEDVALEKKLLYRQMLDDITAETPFDTIKSMLDYLIKSRLITRREAEIIAQTAYNLYKSEAAEKISAEERAKIIRAIFMTLSKF